MRVKSLELGVEATYASRQVRRAQKPPKQDSRGHSSHDVDRLGNYSDESNQARNFWNYMQLPLDSRVGTSICKVMAFKIWTASTCTHVYILGAFFYPCKETRYVRVRIKGRAEGSHCYVQLPMLDPGDILNYLHSHVLEAPMSEVQRYWDSLRSKGLLSNLVTDQHIPVTLYGDEVQINKQGDSILGLYISYTLFKPRKVRTMHYNFFTLRSHLVDGVHTLWPILRRAAASLNAVFDQPGVKFAVAEYKGDWPFLRKLFRFIPSYTGHRILAICLTCFPYGCSCVWHVCERI